MSIPMEIRHYRRKNHRRTWNKSDPRDGSGKATIYTEFGVVEFFTYPGGEHGGAWTSLEMYYNGRQYHTKLLRHYHWRWWLRLAEQFARTAALG